MLTGGIEVALREKSDALMKVAGRGRTLSHLSLARRLTPQKIDF